MAGSRTRLPKLLPVLLLALILLAVTHAWWLPGLAYALIDAHPPEQADIAVVLAGDGYGRRITRGAELVKDGFVPRILASGPRGFYGFHECDLAVPFMVKRGYPAEWFIHFEHDAKSTAEEAVAVREELRRRNVRKFLLVTSDYHTARAGRAFRREIKDIEFVVVAAPDEYFTAENWWKDRESRKYLFFEWTKTIAHLVGGL